MHSKQFGFILGSSSLTIDYAISSINFIIKKYGKDFEIKFVLNEKLDLLDQLTEEGKCSYLISDIESILINDNCDKIYLIDFDRHNVKTCINISHKYITCNSMFK